MQGKETVSFSHRWEPSSPPTLLYSLYWEVVSHSRTDACMPGWWNSDDNKNMFLSTSQETTTCFPCKPDFITPLWWGGQESLLFSLTQHIWEIHCFYFPQCTSFLLFHQVCFLSRLLFPHRISNATHPAGLHRAVGHEIYRRPTRMRTKDCGRGQSWCRKAITARQGRVPGKEKALTLRFGPLKHVR